MKKLEGIQNGSIDESHLWPVCNRFDATERAIRRLRKLRHYNGGLKYFVALDAEIGIVVNEAA